MKKEQETGGKMVRISLSEAQHQHFLGLLSHMGCAMGTQRGSLRYQGNLLPQVVIKQPPY